MIEVSLFAYFMAHAPAEPQPWFQPAMCEPPKSDPAWRFCDNCKHDMGDCEKNADCAKILAYRRAFAYWQERRDRERLLQWPAAWAAEMVQRTSN